MAIIPADEKVFMVSKSTNTTYSGSASLKAMQEWYTMQDVIDTVGGGGGTPTLQQVTDAGSSTTNYINIDVPGGNDALVITNTDNRAITAITTTSECINASSNDAPAIVAHSENGIAIYTNSNGSGPTVSVGNGADGAGIQIQTGSGYSLNAYSDNSTAVYANANGSAPTVYVNAGGDGEGIRTETGSGYAINAYSQNNTAIYANAEGGEPTINVYSDAAKGIYVEAPGYGIHAVSTDNNAIYAYSSSNDAIVGTSIDSNGVTGSSLESSGIYGSSTNGDGVLGNSTDGFGVRGYSTNGFGVYGNSTYGPSVYGTSANGVGGFFSSGSTYSLVAQQSAAKPGGGSWSAYSDSRVKKNVKPYTKGLNEILLVNPVNYEYNGLGDTIEGTEYTGVIAQEIKEIFPETVSTYKAKLNKEDEESTELYDFTSTALTFALINAVKELKAEIDLLKAK